MDPYMNMADTLHTTGPEEPDIFGYYFQIPEKAEVKRVPISMLSSLAQQRITRLGDSTDFIETPNVIVVSPITIQKLPNSHKARTTVSEPSKVTLTDTSQSSDGRSSERRTEKWSREDHGTYLVPVKCPKNIALTILQLSRKSDAEKTLLESELQTISDSLILSLEVMKMKATALCMYKNIMYLLPESNKTNISNDYGEALERLENFCEPQPEEAQNCRAGKSKQEIVPINSPSTIKELRTSSERRHNSFGCVTRLPQECVRLEVCPGGVDGDIQDLPAKGKSDNRSSSSKPSTENNLQISFWEHSRRRRSKRKLSSLGRNENFLKKIHLSGGDTKQNSTDVKVVVNRSPREHDRSTSSPHPQETSPSDPSADPSRGHSADLEGTFSPPSSSLRSPCAAPIFPEPDQSLEDKMSPHLLGVQPCPLWSDISWETSNGPESSREVSPIFHTFRSEHDMFCDIDETTRDEKTQRLLARVRECDQIVEDMRRREKMSSSP
ncbi:uncharacterized protein [Engystomops pustulosus]|uniref:uncharacterized protein n=1 Tax=Engystomops pustulosus TaxID=76066 RepID=UPI003AFA3809